MRILPEIGSISEIVGRIRRVRESAVSFANELDRFVPKRAALAVLLVGFVLFSSSKLALVIVPYFSRQLPVETDDAFAYIIKAAQIDQGCFFQDCESIRDLREQLDWTDPNAKKVSWFRYRLHWPLINVYAPSHSLILAGLHLLGISWVNAYWVLSVVGSIAMSIGIAWWLSTLWGPGGAGLALMALSLVIFPSHGLHFVVPTNLALCVAFFLWTYLLTCKEPHPVAISMIMILMIGFHPAGRAFALIGMAMATLSRPLKHAPVVLITGVVVVGLSYIVPHVVERPDMILEHNPMPDGMSYWAGMLKTAQGAASRMGTTGKLYLATLALVPIALMFYPQDRVKPTTVSILGVAGAFLVSFLYVLPHGWGEVPVRLSVPVGIAAVGSMGYLSWLSVIWLYQRAIARSWGKPSNLISTACGVAAILFVIAFGIQWSHYKFKIQMKIDRQNYEFDRHQTEELLQRIEPHEKILYTNYVPVLLYLTNGLHPYGAVLHRAIRGTPDEATWLSDDRLRFAVARSPIAVKPDYDLRVKDSTPLYVSFDEPLLAEQLLIELESPLSSGTVEISVVYSDTGSDSPTNSRVTRVGMAQGARETVALATPSAKERFIELQLSLVDGEGPVIVASIRKEPEADLRWIWDEGMNVRYSGPDDREMVVRFDTSNIGPEELQPLEVIADRGFTVLAERIR